MDFDPAELLVLESESDHADSLRLWLRLLTCSSLIEGEIRRRLREKFDVTLPRFDLLAQLEKVPEGMTLGELSRRMMVSNGNITGLVERLAELGLVARAPDPNDRRAAFVRLTPAGRASFAEMADAHAGWIKNMFAGLTPAETRAATRLLAGLKQSVRRHIDVREEASDE